MAFPCPWLNAEGLGVAVVGVRRLGLLRMRLWRFEGKGRKGEIGGCAGVCGRIYYAKT